MIPEQVRKALRGMDADFEAEWDEATNTVTIRPARRRHEVVVAAIQRLKERLAPAVPVNRHERRKEAAIARKGNS